MITLDKSTKELFSSFCINNNLTENMEQAIEYFTIFGGLDEKLDFTIPIKELIKKVVLVNYDTFRKEINQIIGGYGVEYAILSGIALGDRKTTTTFKRAHLSFEEGMKCVDNLLDTEIIEIESSQYFLLGKRNDTKTAKKLFFTVPFIRFWFGFISPIYKGIKEGNFEEFDKRYDNYMGEFAQFIFEELCLIFLQNYNFDDEIKQIGKFWDNNLQIDIVAKTKGDKLIVANCKYTNNKLKKSELNRLVDDCSNLQIDPDILILFSKSGFSSELKSLKSEKFKLFSVKHLKQLI